VAVFQPSVAASERKYREVRSTWIREVKESLILEAKEVDNIDWASRNYSEPESKNVRILPLEHLKPSQAPNWKWMERSPQFQMYGNSLLSSASFIIRKQIKQMHFFPENQEQSAINSMQLS